MKTIAYLSLFIFFLTLGFSACNEDNRQKAPQSKRMELDSTSRYSDQNYKEEVEHTVSSLFSYGSFTTMVDTEFRICERCQYKQVREHFTGRESDWSTSELSTEQLRNKKLKELGI